MYSRNNAIKTQETINIPIVINVGNLFTQLKILKIVLGAFDFFKLLY